MDNQDLADNIPEYETKEELKSGQGQAYSEALEFAGTQGPHCAIEADDYHITWIAEAATGLYYPDDEGKLHWTEPTEGENQHIEIVVQDRRDMQFIPELSILVTLLPRSGAEDGPKPVQFMWHPFLYHYAANWAIPAEGDYRLRVTILEPRFPRHDSLLGKRYVRDVTVELGPLHLVPARNPSGPE